MSCKKSRQKGITAMVNSLLGKISKQDIHVSKFNGYSPIICKFQHGFNPMNLIYCRLRKKGIKKKPALTVTNIYEKYVYKPVDRGIKEFYLWKIKKEQNSQKTLSI